MAPRNSVRAPTNAPVPHSLRVPSTAQSLLRSLNRLTKFSLINLALQWLQDDNQPACIPYLVTNRNLEEEVDEDYLWTPAETIEELRLTYNRMKFENTITKRHIIDRILDGDWRRGLSLYQVASIDFQYLSENDKALRWTALKLVPYSDDGDDQEEPLRKRRKINPGPYPTISPSTFLQNLQHEISPLVKAHYHHYRIRTPENLSLLRVCVSESPYINPQASVQSPLLFTDPSRLIFIALPDSCPYIYVSVSGATKQSSSTKKKSLPAGMDVASLKRTVLEAIPKALSKAQNRYSLESTSLTARSLSTMLALRGNSGTNAANGVYTIFAKGVVDNSPIDAQRTTFAQKILQACEREKDNECDSTHPELSLRSREQGTDRTALAEKSINLLQSANPGSGEAKMELKIAAAARFGMAGLQQKDTDSTEEESASKTTDVLDRLQIRLDEDLFSRTGRRPAKAHGTPHYDIHPFDQTSPSEQKSTATHRQDSARMTLTFQGSNVILGIRKLVELGAIKVDKLPSWMTGEEAISGGTARQGLVVHGKGGGA